MLGPIDYALWLLGVVVTGYVVVHAVVRKIFVRYLTLNMYMAAVCFVTVGQYLFVQRYGLASLEYRYFYYYTDSLLVIFLYFAVLSLYQHVFAEMHVSRYIRGASVVLLAATALFSYLVVHQYRDHMMDRFVVEIGQNLYFVGVILVYLLWGAVLTLRESRTRIVQLVLALGIYFSGFAAAYAMRNMFPAMMPLFRWIPPLLGAFLPLAWAYTFTMVSEDARLATSSVARIPARVAAAHR